MTTAIERIERTYHRAFRPEPRMTISEFADAEVLIPQEGSAEYGRFRTSRVPYLQAIMDALSPYSGTEEIDVIKGTQLGVTTMGNTWWAFTVKHAPGPFLMVQPTEDIADRHAKQKIAPMIRDMKCLSDNIRESRLKDSGNTKMIKTYPGGMLIMGGANSSKIFRHTSYRYLMLDDIDGWPRDVDGEGDPVGLAINRTDAFTANRKILKMSTPTIDGISRIALTMPSTTQEYYYVPCPYCNHMQPLMWKGIKWEHDNQYKLTSEVTFICAACERKIEEYWKPKMMAIGTAEWQPHNPDAGIKRRGFYIPSLYSPWLSWQQIVEEFLEAKKYRDETLLKRWVTTRLAETWKSGEKGVDSKTLTARCEHYGLWLPEGVLTLTCGVDVQDDRIEAEVFGWRRESKNPNEPLECWPITNPVFHGNTSQGLVWQQLDDFLKTKFKHESGIELAISVTFIDSGHKSQEVYSFVRPRQHRGIFAIKGSNNPKDPIIAKWSIQKQYKVKLFIIGVNTAKDVIYSRLKIDIPGPGYIHFPAHCTEEYFAQLTSERAYYEKGYKIYRTPKKKGEEGKRRNETLDRHVYGLAAITMLNPNFEVLKERLERQAAMIAQKPTQPATAPVVSGQSATNTGSQRRGRHVLHRGILGRL